MVAGQMRLVGPGMRADQPDAEFLAHGKVFPMEAA
jgi:hypothetical protein